MKFKQPDSITYCSLIFPKKPFEAFGVTAARAIADKMAEQKIGEAKAALIPMAPGFPAWFYFLVFQKAASGFPEVAVEIFPGEFLVLRSIFRGPGYSRPAAAHLLEDFIKLPATSQSARRKEIKVNLTELPEINFENIQEAVQAAREAGPFCQRLIFSGNTGQASALIFYALLSPYCRGVFYEFDNHFLQAV